MGIISGMVERRRPRGEERSFRLDDPASTAWFLRWMGGGGPSDAGVYVSEHTALNSLLVMSCVRILAETVATLPMMTYKRLDPRGRERAPEHAIYHVLHDEPNRYMSSVTYYEQMMAHLALWGNHYSEIKRAGRANDVEALIPIHPRRVEPRMTDRGELRYRIDGKADSEIPAENMLHVPGLAMEGLKGLSPLSMMRQALGMTVQAEAFGARFFANDARPSVLLKHPGTLKEDARRNLKTSWVEMHGGDKRGGVAILEEGMDVSALGIPPDDAQFLETRRFQVQEFARFFRIPPHMLADVDGSTSWGTGIEQQTIGFVIHSVRSWLVRIEKESNRKLFSSRDRDRYYCEFLIDALLRGDLKARADYYATSRQWGWMNTDDIRDKENMNPLPDGKGQIYLQPMNMIEAGSDPDLPDRDETPPEPDEPDAGDDDERGMGRGAECRDRRDREARSAAARLRLASQAQRVYRDAISRTIDREVEQVRSAVRRLSAGAFREWVGDHYNETLPPRIVRTMMPVAGTLAEGIAAEAADELGSEPPDSDQIDIWVRDYAEVMAKRHCGTSRSRLLRLLNDYAEGREARAESDLVDLVDEELDEWGERVDNEAQDESTRTAGYIAWAVYGWLGVRVLRWLTAGADPCDYCQSLSGTSVNYGSAFLGAGEELAPGGIDAFVSLSSVSHPPLHAGCQCVIVPG